MEAERFSNLAVGFTKSPLGILALFIVLVYAFASLVVGTNNNHTLGDLQPLVWFMVIFPFLVFFGFIWLVAKHHNKLYGPSDYKNEDNFLKAQLASAIALTAAVTKDGSSGTSKDETMVNKIIETLKEASTSRPYSDNNWRNRILWVDDRPENNVYERKAFEAQGIRFTLALSTNEALDACKNNKYSVIISDMGRKEGMNEGYVLLDKLRKTGNETPFIIYAGSNLPEHKEMAISKGAIGSTNRADELFTLVMNVVNNR